jgi:hypothetical protein
MSLRAFIYKGLTTHPPLVALGLRPGNVFAAQVFDGTEADPLPAEDFFAVYRISSATPGLAGTRGSGRVREATVALWVYDKQKDFDLRISPILKVWEELMDSYESEDLGSGGWTMGNAYVGQSDDTWDDVYERITRSSAYTIVYTGQ